MPEGDGAEARGSLCQLPRRRRGIERWMADEPVTAWREPWTRTLTRWLTRHRTGVTGAAAARLQAWWGWRRCWRCRCGLGN